MADAVGGADEAAMASIRKVYGLDRSLPEQFVTYLGKAVPRDPWGQPYQYRAPGEHGEFDLFSLGRDGQPGGTGEAADIGNW